jgi:flagellar biosynthesis protein FliR
MYRRRRRRSSFARRTPPQLRLVVIGVGVAVFIGLFVFFIGQSDRLAPAPQEIRVEVEDAFKE